MQTSKNYTTKFMLCNINRTLSAGNEDLRIASLMLRLYLLAVWYCSGL